MGEIKDKNGTPLAVGDVIRVGDNRYATIHKIKSFYTMDGGTILMIKTDDGDYNVKNVVKCV